MRASTSIMDEVIPTVNNTAANNSEITNSGVCNRTWFRKSHHKTRAKKTQPTAWQKRNGKKLRA